MSKVAAAAHFLRIDLNYTARAKEGFITFFEHEPTTIYKPPNAKEDVALSPLARSPSYQDHIEIPSYKLRFLAQDFVLKSISHQSIMSTLDPPSHLPSTLEKPDDLPSTPTDSEKSPRKKNIWAGKSGKFWTAFAMLNLTAFISALDAVIIAAALPAITADLGGSSNQAFWSGTGFLLAATITQPLWGTFSEIFGRRGNLVTSLLWFLVGSILCARSSYMGMFIGSRVVYQSICGP